MKTNLFFGNSKKFREIMARGDRFARTEWPVLLLGETGVGKELLARRLHEQSTRARAPFIPVNCAAMPHGLFESELFGYERGAFSGALNSTRGLVKSADGGTLFLDEIGDLDLSMQVKLLRLLDSGEVRAVGSQRIDQVNVRIIAATNINLYTAVAEGRFRLDLLERLSVLVLQVPPLRERPEDLKLIAESILETLGVSVEEGVMSLLEAFHWPGNIRQLKNVLVRAAVLGNGRVTAGLVKTLLEEEIENALELEPQNAPQFNTDLSLADIEKRVIVERLRRYHGNRKKTAEDLGIAKSTLHEKLRKWKQGGDTSYPLDRYPLSHSVGV